MAQMIDKKPEYYGESLAWESFSKNLPSEVVVYNHREIKGREFDFCLLIKNMGMLIIEVKGWKAEDIFDVAGVDEVIILGYSKPERSPKKQARAYRFGLLNMISDRYNVSPLIFDMVCYPFITKSEYIDKRLDIVSDANLTIFKEDLCDELALGDKILKAYNQSKSIPHAEMNDSLIAKIRQHFEPHFQITKPIEATTQNPYSKIVVIPGTMPKKEIKSIINDYLSGIKLVIFISNLDLADQVLYSLEGELDERNIGIDKNNLVIKIGIQNNFSIENNSFRAFNFELYIVESLGTIINQNITIYEGKFTYEEKHIINCIAEKSMFNIQQYFIEHAPVDKNILVRAGAGTGKTYSMVSRIAYLCNKYEEPIINVINDIAMVTFTNDAAENMKKRLKQLFINYFTLTRNPKFIKYIENVNFMQISTIHKFARDVIKEYSMQMGLGNDFAITSGDYAKEQIYEKYLNTFIEKKYEENPNFMNEIKLPLYQFKHMLVELSNQLYNKSVDIKKIRIEELGQPVPSMPFFNEIILDVIIAAENEYEQKIQETNKVDLRETMILLNGVVNQKNKEKTHLEYKYIFIDEFQDTDDAQIDSFLKIQQMIESDCKLFVVGDLKQSIYRFRGATISAFKMLNATPDNWEELTITTNYRTDSRLLKILGNIFSKMGASQWLPYVEEKDELTSSLEAGANEKELFACVPFHGNNEGEQFDVLIDLLLSEKAKIQELEKNRKLSLEEKTIAILVRENWQIDKIVRACKEKNSDIEIQTKVGGDLYQLEPIMDFYKLLLALSNPVDPLYLINVIESNYVGLSLKYQGIQHLEKTEQRKKLTEVLDKFFEIRMSMKWSELIAYVHAKPILVVLKNIYEALQPWKQFSKEDERQRFYKSNYELLLEKIIKNYSLDYLTLNVICNSVKINILTKQQELARNTNEDDSDIRFFCTTVHKAKGLEYGTVILPYTGQAIDNLKKANTDVNYTNSKLAYSIKVDENRKECNSNYNSEEEIGQRVCEEARVLYVALTRAIRKCIWMKDLDKKGTICWSRFLEG